LNPWIWQPAPELQQNLRTSGISAAGGPEHLDQNGALSYNRNADSRFSESDAWQKGAPG